MNTKVGRNDPCPCGSGKKYKRCHLPLDQQAKPRVEMKPVIVQAPEDDPESIPPAIPANPSASFLRDLVDKVPKKSRAKFNTLLSQTLEVNLLKHLPFYVKAGRFMDAWIIQFCGIATSDHVQESNAFLYAMFCHGFDAWEAEKQAREDEWLSDECPELP